MKILYVITKSEPGGAQSVVSELITEHVKRGDKVGLLVDKTGWLTSKADMSGAEVFYNSHFSNSKNPLDHIRALIRTIKIINAYRPDLISSHSFAAGVQARLANFGRRPIIHTAHGISFTGGTPVWRKVISIMAEGVLGLMTNKIICVSKNDKTTISRTIPYLERKIAVIHNGVIVPEEKAAFDGEKIKLLYVGRMAAPKTPWQVINALDALTSEEQEKFELTFVGSGSYFEDLKERVDKCDLETRVYFTELLAREEVIAEYQNAHLFIFTSRWEGFPMTILEAMASGIPVVASNVGGVREVVDKEVGWLLPKTDEVDAIKNILRSVARNEVSLKEKGEKARLKIETHFTVQRMTRETFALIDEAMRSRA